MAFRDTGERWDEFDMEDRRANRTPTPPAPPVVDEGLRVRPGPFDQPDPPPVPPTEGADFGSFSLPGYTGPFQPNFNFGPPPQFRPEMFQGVGFDEAMNEPGFQFRLKSGTDALERSAAARGVLRTGGTLKDLVEYGQNFASGEYQNVFNRALQSYLTRYQAQKDMFAPYLADWQARAGAETQGGLAAFQMPYNIWVQQMLAAQANEDRIARTAMPQPPADVYAS